MGLKGDKRKLGMILSGQPILVPKANIFITQPKIKDIVLFGEDDFLTGIQLLVDLQKFAKVIKEGNSDLVIYSDFQLLLMMFTEDPTVNNLVRSLFDLLFPEYKINITDNTIDFLLEDSDEKVVGRLYPFNYEEFQEILHDLFIPQNDNEREPDYNPANDAAAKIAEKIKKGREKVHAQKTAAEGGEQSVFANYCSTLSIGMHMDINIFFNYTPFQLYDSYKRFFSKEASDFYMRISSMPLMDTSKMDAPPDWQRNLY
jgi:hypothetical protein